MYNKIVIFIFLSINSLALQAQLYESPEHDGQVRIYCHGREPQRVSRFEPEPVVETSVNEDNEEEPVVYEYQSNEFTEVIPSVDDNDKDVLVWYKAVNEEGAVVEESELDEQDAEVLPPSVDELNSGKHTFYVAYRNYTKEYEPEVSMIQKNVINYIKWEALKNPSPGNQNAFPIVELPNASELIDQNSFPEISQYEEGVQNQIFALPEVDQSNKSNQGPIYTESRRSKVVLKIKTKPIPPFFLPIEGCIGSTILENKLRMLSTFDNVTWIDLTDIGPDFDIELEILEKQKRFNSYLSNFDSTFSNQAITEVFGDAPLVDVSEKRTHHFIAQRYNGCGLSERAYVQVDVVERGTEAPENFNFEECGNDKDSTEFISAINNFYGDPFSFLKNPLVPTFMKAYYPKLHKASGKALYISGDRAEDVYSLYVSNPQEFMDSIILFEDSIAKLIQSVMPSVDKDGLITSLMSNLYSLASMDGEEINSKLERIDSVIGIVQNPFSPFKDVKFSFLPPNIVTGSDTSGVILRLNKRTTCGYTGPARIDFKYSYPMINLLSPPIFQVGTGNQVVRIVSNFGDSIPLNSITKYGERLPLGEVDTSGFEATILAMDGQTEIVVPDVYGNKIEYYSGSEHQSIIVNTYSPDIQYYSVSSNYKGCNTNTLNIKVEVVDSIIKTAPRDIEIFVPINSGPYTTQKIKNNFHLVDGYQIEINNNGNYTIDNFNISTDSAGVFVFNCRVVNSLGVPADGPQFNVNFNVINNVVVSPSYTFCSIDSIHFDDLLFSSNHIVVYSLNNKKFYSSISALLINSTINSGDSLYISQLNTNEQFPNGISVENTVPRTSTRIHLLDEDLTAFEQSYFHTNNDSVFIPDTIIQCNRGDEFRYKFQYFNPSYSLNWYGLDTLSKADFPTYSTDSIGVFNYYYSFSNVCGNESKKFAVVVKIRGGRPAPFFETITQCMGSGLNDYKEIVSNTYGDSLANKSIFWFNKENSYFLPAHTQYDYLFMHGTGTAVFSYPINDSVPGLHHYYHQHYKNEACAEPYEFKIEMVNDEAGAPTINDLNYQPAVTFLYNPNDTIVELPQNDDSGHAIKWYKYLADRNNVTQISISELDSASKTYYIAAFNPCGESARQKVELSFIQVNDSVLTWDSPTMITMCDVRNNITFNPKNVLGEDSTATIVWYKTSQSVNGSIIPPQISFAKADTLTFYLKKVSSMGISEMKTLKVLPLKPLELPDFPDVLVTDRPGDILRNTDFSNNKVQWYTGADQEVGVQYLPPEYSYNWIYRYSVRMGGDSLRWYLQSNGHGKPDRVDMEWPQYLYASKVGGCLTKKIRVLKGNRVNENNSMLVATKINFAANDLDSLLLVDSIVNPPMNLTFEITQGSEIKALPIPTTKGFSYPIWVKKEIYDADSNSAMLRIDSIYPATNKLGKQEYYYSYRLFDYVQGYFFTDGSGRNITLKPKHTKLGKITVNVVTPEVCDLTSAYYGATAIDVCENSRLQMFNNDNLAIQWKGVVYQDELLDEAAQDYRFEIYGNYYRIKDLKSGEYLYAFNDALTGELQLGMRPFETGNDGYLWKLRESVHKFHGNIFSKIDETKCLRVAGSSKDAGAQIVLDDFRASWSSQAFRLAGKPALLKDFTTTIENKYSQLFLTSIGDTELKSGFIPPYFGKYYVTLGFGTACALDRSIEVDLISSMLDEVTDQTICVGDQLDVPDDSQGFVFRRPISQNEVSNEDNQNFRFEIVGQYFRIKNMKTDKYLCVEFDEFKNEYTVITRRLPIDINDKFLWSTKESNFSGFGNILSKLVPNKCLRVANSSEDNGVSIVLDNYHPNWSSEAFKLAGRPISKKDFVTTIQNRYSKKYLEDLSSVEIVNNHNPPTTSVTYWVAYDSPFGVCSRMEKQVFVDVVDDCSASDLVNGKMMRSKTQTFGKDVQSEVALEDAGLTSVAIYPNPANNDLFVDIRMTDDNKDNVMLTFISLTGEVIFEANIDENSGSVIRKIDVSSLSSGVYFVRVQSKNDLILNRVIIAR